MKFLKIADLINWKKYLLIGLFFMLFINFKSAGNCVTSSKNELDLSVRFLTVSEDMVKDTDLLIAVLEYRETRHIPFITYERVPGGHGPGSTYLPREKTILMRIPRSTLSGNDPDFLFFAGAIKKSFFSPGSYRLYRIKLYYYPCSFPLISNVPVKMNDPRIQLLPETFFNDIEPDIRINIDDLLFKSGNSEKSHMEKIPETYENGKFKIRLRRIPPAQNDNNVTVPFSIDSIILEIE